MTDEKPAWAILFILANPGKTSNVVIQTNTTPGREKSRQEGKICGDNKSTFLPKIFVFDPEPIDLYKDGSVRSSHLTSINV